MIEEPGSFSGITSSPSPQRGPDAIQPHVVGDFHQDTGQRFKRAAGGRQGLMAGEGGKLVGRGLKGQSGELGDFLGNPIGKLGMGIQTRSRPRFLPEPVHTSREARP